MHTQLPSEVTWPGVGSPGRYNSGSQESDPQHNDSQGET